MSAGISLIICCYNAEWILGRTLKHLLELETNGLPGWEVIIVDNNSSDRTGELVTDFIRSNNLETIFRLCREEKQGLSFARLKGISEASFDILLFCDDDNFLSPSYLLTSWSIMKEHPEIALLGGRGEALYEKDPDPAILPFLEQYAVGSQGEADLEDITHSRGYVYGAGMVLRKQAFDVIWEKGFRFLNSGRTGSILTGSEDVEIGNALRMAGYRIFYSKDLTFGHFLSSGRLTWKYLERMNYGSGYSSVLMIPYAFRGNRTFRASVPYITLWYIGRHILYLMRRLFHPGDAGLILEMQQSKGALEALRMGPRLLKRNLAIHREFIRNLEQ